MAEGPKLRPKVASFFVLRFKHTFETELERLDGTKLPAFSEFAGKRVGEVRASVTPTVFSAELAKETVFNDDRKRDLGRMKGTLASPMARGSPG